jgi:cell division protein FtsL
MVDNGLNVLWRGKIYIALVFLLLLVTAGLAYFYLDSRGLSSQLGQKQSDYDTLNGTYLQLSLDHSALVNDNKDLKGRYDNLSDRYNRLSVDDLYLRSSYDSLNGTVSRFQETGGVVIALYYSFYQTGSGSGAKKVCEATAYNVGNKRADRLTIKCLTIDNGSSSTSQQAFTNVDGLDKRHSRWEYNNTTQLDHVWIEL